MAFKREYTLVLGFVAVTQGEKGDDTLSFNAMVEMVDFWV